MRTVHHVLAALTLLVIACRPLCHAQPSGSRVTIDGDQVLVVNGRKVFPIGFTMPPPPDGKTRSGKDAIQELRDAGATFLRTGVMGKAWDDAAVEQEQKYLDAAARCGMYCLPALRELGSVAPDQPQREAMLRRVVTRFRDHPGLGAWKGVDEPEWGKNPVDPMVRAYHIIRELDPHHPVWVNQAPRGTVDSLRGYDPTYDITGCDIYPIGYPPGMHSTRPNKQISMVGDFTRTMTDVTRGKKPVWMVLQISWSGVIKPGKILRMPTFAEQRFMTYQAIVNGARGVIYFGGHIPKAMTPEDAKLGWNWTFWDRVLRRVIEEIGDRSPLSPALVAPNSRLPIRVSGASDVEFCVRETAGDLFILACKREGATVQVQFDGLPPGATDGEVLFESPRHVQAQDGRFSDWFAPFEAHVYRFRKG